MLYFLPSIENSDTKQNLIIGSATEWYEGIEEDLRNKNQPYF